MLHARDIPRLRWRIGGLLGLGVLINYFDRISISVAGPQLERSFNLTPVVGGWLVDFLVARRHDETRVRKAVLVIGMCTALAVIGATVTDRPLVALTWISLALTGLGAAAPVAWSLPSLIAPKGGVGAVGGIMNFSNNMMGVVAPVVTGFIVGRTHSFAGVFLAAGLVLVAGVASFILLLGPIEVLPEPPVRRGA